MPRTGEGKRVIVIGAGIAGVTAAQKLDALGYKVILLEALADTGGRARNNRDGIPLGPMVAHEVGDYEGEGGIKAYIKAHPEYLFSEEDLSQTQPMPALLKEYGIPLLEGSAHDNLTKNIIVIGEKAKHFDKAKFRDLADHYQKEFLQNYFLEFTKQDNDLEIEERLAKELTIRFEEAYSGLTMNELTQIMKNAKKNDISFFKYGDTHPLVCEGGYDFLIRQITKQFKNVDIHFSTIVKKLEAISGKVYVTTSTGTQFEGDAVISTLPLGVLQKGQVEILNLSAEKKQAIQHLKMGLMNKIFIKFEKQFWDPAANVVLVLNTHPEKRAVSVYINPNKLVSTIPPTLIASFFAEDAMRPNEKLAEEALTGIREAWPDAPPPVSYEAITWQEDPFSYGSYASFSKDTRGEDVVNIMRPEWGGRLLFAGDAIIPIGLMGCFHGAYISALRAARLMDEYLTTVGKETNKEKS